MKIYQLGQLPEEIYPFVGGKAKGLDMLVRQGFSVPQGFVITETEQIDEESVYQAFDAMNARQVSVRSSASNEDQSAVSNAGQYETCLFVDRAHLMESVRKCLDSLNSRRVEDYARHFELGRGAMNIVVQEMIDSEKAGVLFTAGPNNGSAILIEAVEGQGENLVSVRFLPADTRFPANVTALAVTICSMRTKSGNSMRPEKKCVRFLERRRIWNGPSTKANSTCCKCAPSRRKSLTLRSSTVTMT